MLCAGLDVVALIGCAALIDRMGGGVFREHPFTLAFVGTVYLLFSWLFGSYTVLRWPWLRLRLVLLRLGLASIGTLLMIVFASWAFNVFAPLQLIDREHQLWLLSLLTFFSLVLRLMLRPLSMACHHQSWKLIAKPEEIHQIQAEWSLNSSFFNAPNLFQGEHSPGGFALGLRHQMGLPPALFNQIQDLASQGVPIATVQELAEQQLERLPPALLPDEWMAIHQIPWNNCFSVQRQLKRAADVGLSLFLLLLTSPLLILSGFLIWLEDGGPVFYTQLRSGLMQSPFLLLKLRTMRPQHGRHPSWTQPGDSRITRIGHFLRRTRLDELPQLVNVLKGEMSLIGPRPERPELEMKLEMKIPHYRKRHWMPPGLSGWAQVCAPYASTLEEVELKLSYDLFYLRNWNTGLDLLILAKTIKTILKASGR